MEAFPSLLLLLLLLLPLVTSSGPPYRYCDTDANFTADSVYQSNLRTLLGSLASSAMPSGFNFSSLGSPPDRVNALVLCRGGQSKESCQTCRKSITSDAEQNCPYAKSARIFDDDCHLRYSMKNFSGKFDDNTSRHCRRIGKNVSSADDARFEESAHTLLGELRSFAVHNATSPPLFAAGEIEFGGTYEIESDGTYEKIYGTVQCTRDISAQQCDKCLGNIMDKFSQCYRHKARTRALTGICIWRFDTNQFFNWTQKLTIPALPVVPPPPRTRTPTNVVPPSSPPSSGGDNKKVKVMVLAIAIPSIIFLVLNLIGCICLYRRMKAPASTRSNMDGTMQETSNNDSFSLDSIKRATNNFSPLNKLGEGGFGPVYKGKLSDGRHVAVKRLSTGSSQGMEELNNEMLLQTRLRHRNLASLLGACVECGEKLLIYEFVVNGSLDDYLSDHVKKLLLNWQVRRKIIVGITRGMLYLHEESQLKIIHRDIKASNILLDGEMNPKISDFGMARLFDRNQTHACTNKVVGTFGYMPPEYVLEKKYSMKSDIYSFGVLILEVITGRRNCEPLKENSEDSFLLNYVWDHWLKKSPTAIVDTSMEGNFPPDEALRFIHIGLLCVQDNPKKRPTMEEIELMLGRASISIPTPQTPSFISRTTSNVESPRMYSLNEVSVSEFEPR